MMIWITSGWLHFIAGFALGWIVFKRPDWATAAIAWVKSKLGF